MQVITACPSVTETLPRRGALISLVAGRDAQFSSVQALWKLQLPWQFTAPNSSFTQAEISRAFVGMEGFGSPSLRFAHLGPFSKDQLRRTINFCTCFASWQFGLLAGVIRVLQETSIRQQLLAGHSAGLNPSSTSTWTLRRRRIKHSIYTCMDICALEKPTSIFNEKSSSTENSSVKIFNTLEMRRTGVQKSNMPPECKQVVEILEKNMHLMHKSMSLTS